jgi:hypothetical protein
MIRVLRVRVGEILLAVSTICVTYFLAEAAFALVGISHVPLHLHPDLPGDIRVFAQSSKAGVIPRDPVVLLGDSYAEGYGDWLLQSLGHGNGRFHSAHVINRLTGRDVVTLGVGGGGSAEGIAAYPAMAYAYAKTAWYLRLPPPHVAVIYFYEGNDLNDNMRFLARRVPRLDEDDLSARIDRALAAYPSSFPAPAAWSLHLPLFRFLQNVADRRFNDLTSRGPAATPAGGAGVAHAAQANPASPDPVAGVVPKPESNVAEVNGQTIELPTALQSPGLELTDQELRLGALVFERSLAFLRRLLADTPILVVYLPSPLASYRLLSPHVSIQRYLLDSAVGPYPTERVAEYSNAICSLIRKATVGQHAGFFDFRPVIRAAGIRELMHGPLDFKHFNKKGMELLGEAVAERTSRPLDQESCRPIAN